MLLTRPHNVCTLDTSGRIVGNVPLAWSQDDCIAVATSSYVMLYDLNPFKNISHSRMQFKTQIIPNPTKLGYDGGIGEFISSYDEGRILSSRDSVTPNIDIYLTHLDPSLNQSEAEEIKNSGFKAVGFSPLGCSKNEGVLLAFLTCSHRLQIFSRKSDGTNIEWTMDQDLSDILVNILEKNDGQYPDISFPEAKSDIRRAWQLRYAACVDNFVWSSIYSVPDTNEKHVYLLASTRMNYILIWKLTLPFGAESSVEIIAYIKAFDDGTVSSVASLPNLDEGLKFCVGNTDGRIIGIAVDHDGQEFSRNVIWGDQDELSVHCMDWKSVPEDESYNCLIAAKGFMIVGFKICDLQEISYSVVNHAHSLPVGSVGALDDSAWISASREGNITKIKHYSSTNTLTNETVVEKRTTSPLFREITHSVVISPRKAFMAVLCSEPKVTRSVMTTNCSYVDICALTTGMNSFELLCNTDQGLQPPMDAVESLRQHLLRKEITGNPSEYVMLTACIEQYVSSDSAPGPLKWCLAKILCAVPKMEKAQELLHTLEKTIAKRQMMTLLKWLLDQPSANAWSKLPVRSIIEWLKSNHNLVDTSELKLIGDIEANHKFRVIGKEFCEVTGEPMIISPNGKCAITASSKIEWPRCCFTFRALQGFHHLRCELSNARSAILDEDLQELQHGHCIYAGHPMI